MKTLSWSGFFAPWRTRSAREPGRLARLLELLGRGSIPVDGGNIAEGEAARERRPQPVRWGNFR